MRKTVPVEVRFWAKVDKSGECWEWTGAKNRAGYGMLKAGAANGSNTIAHRYSWTLVNGEIPDGLKILHKCDNPGCVRPSHLFLGTQKDNVHDMIAKGRDTAIKEQKGEKHPRAKLTNSQVDEIRSSDKTLGELAKIYSLNKSYVCDIRKFRHRRING